MDVGVLTAASAQSVRFVVALAKGRGTLRCRRSQSFAPFSHLLHALDVLILVNVSSVS